MRWDYSALSDKDALADNRPSKLYPPSGTIAGIYIQAISAYAPHPNAAKLWMEYSIATKVKIFGSKATAIRSAIMTCNLVTLSC